MVEFTRRLFLRINQKDVLQSALVISNSKGLSEIHRDIRSSTYQISRIEKIKSNNQMPQIHM